MARYVNKLGAVGDDLNALHNKAIDNRPDSLLVAGNGARGKNDAITLVKRDLRVIVIGDARQCRTGLALASRTQRQHLVGRKMAIEIGPSKALDALKMSSFTRNLHDPLHGTPDHDHFPT